MSKIKNEIGNVYGYLTVMERAENRSGKAYWKCKCRCGNIKEVNGTALRTGKTKSCGCYQKEQTAKSTLIDLTGQTIGNFTVLKYIMGSKTSGGAKWQCKCNLCGNTDVIITTPNLNKQESCGCLTESKGARKIKQILYENNINFYQEKTFSELKFLDTNHMARYDFYLPDYNCLIEYDGIQHFKSGNGAYDNEEKFKKTQEHDLIKNMWAKENHFYLIRIPYTHLDFLSLEDLLPKTSNFIL